MGLCGHIVCVWPCMMSSLFVPLAWHHHRVFWVVVCYMAVVLLVEMNTLRVKKFTLSLKHLDKRDFHKTTVIRLYNNMSLLPVSLYWFLGLRNKYNTCAGCNIHSHYPRYQINWLCFSYILRKKGLVVPKTVFSFNFHCSCRITLFESLKNLFIMILCRTIMRGV